MCPGPFFLSEGEKAVVCPVLKVFGSFDTDAIFGGVEHDIFVVFDEDTGVFTGLHVSKVDPGFEVVGVGHAGAVLFVEAPPAVWYIFVGNEIGVDHTAHVLAGDFGAFDANELGFRPSV